MNLIDFEDINIVSSPYVEEYFNRFGCWPTIVVKSQINIPVRYMLGRFKMMPYAAGARFNVTGVEGGKRYEKNIIAQYIGSSAEIVITPPFLLKNFSIIGPAIEPEFKNDKGQLEAETESPLGAALKRRLNDATYFLNIVHS